MAKVKLADRVAALEAEAARLKEEVTRLAGRSGDWLDTVYGAFANDPDFEEAKRLGREWRESFRPKACKRRKQHEGR